MFGGQSCVDLDNCMGYFVPITLQGIEEELAPTKPYVPEDIYNKLVEDKLNKLIHQAAQNVVYNLNTMHSRAGSQVPFSSLNIGLPKDKYAALFCEVLLDEYDKGLGKGEQCIFPNIIFARKRGVNANEGDPYYHLYQKACDVASRHMNPTFMNVDSKINMEMYSQGIRPAIMGCRTYLGTNINGEDGPARRGNNAPTTINLPRLGIEANKNLDTFFGLLKQQCINARDSLLYRHDILCKLRVKDLPFVAGEGIMMGSENLGPDDSIEPILKNGSYGIGFIGVAETVYALLGSHHGETQEAWDLAYKIVEYIRNFCDKTKEETMLNFSCYASPRH